MSESTQPTEKVNYKPTLNLPKTSFPMRANLAQNEPQSMKRWDKQRLYGLVNEARRDGQPFVFHDGPPYANGSIHAGHLLNKVLKDIVVRSRLMAGKNCPYVPGWDCHGLPIEHRVMTGLVESGKIAKFNTLTDNQRRMAIRRECRKYADKHIKLQAQQMQRLLTHADYDNPYLTMTPDYEQAVLEVFADLVQQDLVFRALKSVHWSIENQTALADAELEYYDKTDISVYVDFEAVDRDAVAQAFGVELDQTPTFMIWTTTPWTLPANLAIAVHEKFRYALVLVDGNVTIIASELLNKVTAAAKSEAVEVLAETDGSKLVGLRYRHPFCDRESPVVAADYVTLEDGTGLVHTAPGHGVDDYNTGLREGLDIYCPVLGDGSYDDTVPEWLVGKNIWKANSEIVEHLRRSGHLFHDHEFVHSYPHDWRGKSPVIFRATDQWFVGVERPTRWDKQSLQQLALDKTETEVNFIPQWGRNRMRGMLESRPDWCLSRQRAWGLPIPAFAMENDEVFLTAASVRAVAKRFGEHEGGSDAWFTEAPEELLRHYNPADDPDAPDNLDVARLKPMYDIFDVWFESGSSWNAVMRQRDLGYPVDLYLEGSDQHRGWFQLSLLPALAVTGQPPFRTLLTHGFVVDKDGRKMSKSGGNALDVEAVLKDYGADVCRWWVSSLSYENDVKADTGFFDLASESYRKVRNTLRFLLSNLFDYDANQSDAAQLPAPNALDAWIMHEAGRLQQQVAAAYTTYEFRRVHQLLYDFCNDTLSATYCAAVKDRLYCDAEDADRRRSTQRAMFTIADMLSRLLAPIMPHTADETFRALHNADDPMQTVHLQTQVELPDWPCNERWPSILELRDVLLKAVEMAKSSLDVDNPLDIGVKLQLLSNEEVVRSFEYQDLADLVGVSRIDEEPSNTDVEPSVSGVVFRAYDLRDEPRCDRCWRRTVDTTARSDGATLCDRCADAMK